MTRPCCSLAGHDLMDEEAAAWLASPQSSPPIHPVADCRNSPLECEGFVALRSMKIRRTGARRKKASECSCRKAKGQLVEYVKRKKDTKVSEVFKSSVTQRRI